VQLPVDRPVVCTVLIGRDTYIEALDAFLEQVGPTHGQTVLISGEAGIGKSRLLASLRTWAKYTQPTPVSGTWQAELFGADVPAGGENVTILVGQAPVDSSPPIITPHISGLQGLGGWYRGDVTITWDVSGPKSGISSSSGCSPITIMSFSDSVCSDATRVSGSKSSPSDPRLSGKSSKPDLLVSGPEAWLPVFWR
jgi:hypothetical protein